MMDHILTLLGHATILAAVVIPSVEALRKQVPAIDGWKVLLAALLFSLAFAGVAAKPADLAGWADLSGIALLATVLAVGGDAWVGKVAAKVGGK